MTPQELQQCLEEAFGDLAPPYFEELTVSYGLDPEFEVAVTTDTGRTKRWQELRPLSQYLGSAVDIFLLTPKAWQYYLPAYLYAMTDPPALWRYLSFVLSTLWSEGECAHPVSNYPQLRDGWEKLEALLTDRQKRCIAHWLVEVLKSINDPSVEGYEEVNIEADRIEHMLKKYWNAWL
jgi:hypothetical protein